MRNSQRGQALVELALILPLFLLLMLGGADLIMAFSARQNVNYVAEETARCWAVNYPGGCGGGTATAYAQTVALGVGLPSYQNLTATESCNLQCVVTVTYPFNPIFPFFPKNIPLTSTAQYTVATGGGPPGPTP